MRRLPPHYGVLTFSYSFVALPRLVDEVSLDGFDIGFCEDVVEALHVERGEIALEHNVLELDMHLRQQLTQVGRDAWAEHVAAVTLLGELDLAVLDLRGARRVLRRFWEGFVGTRLRRRHGRLGS